MTMLSATAAIMLVLQAAPQLQKATIEGVVRQAGSNEPVAQAKVTLSPPDAVLLSQITAAIKAEQSMPTIPSVRTDDQGRFVIKDIEPGSYQLSVSRNGYVSQEYGQRSARVYDSQNSAAVQAALFSGAELSLRNSGTVINLGAGETMTDVVFHLIPTGTVTGRVTDSAGEPIPGISVRLLRSAYDATGTRVLKNDQEAVTNDRGEYRLFFVRPGHYYIAATVPVEISPWEAAQSTSFNSTGPGPTQKPGEVLDPGYAHTYFYPGATVASQAAPVDVQPGGDVGAIDFKLVRQRQGFRVRGRVIDANTGQPPARLPRIQINTVPGDERGTLMNAQTYDRASGGFEFRDVAPGPYTVYATLFPTNESPRFSLGLARVDVAGSDVENLALTISSGISIQGRINVDGALAFASVPGMDHIGIGLTPATAEPPVGVKADAIKENGTFTIEGVLPGEYRVAVSGLPPNAYVKAVHLGADDLLQRTLSIADTVSGAIEILISPNGGTFHGTVVDNDLKPIPGIEVVLVPDRQRDRPDLYKTAISDEKGQFRISGISPGGYQIFAWEDIEEYGYFDPDILRRYEDLSKPVNISESATTSVEVRLIAAPDQSN